MMSGILTESKAGTPRRWLILAALLWSTIACASSSAPAPHSNATASGEPLEFTFAGVDGNPLTSESVRGRVTVLLFLTTFDIASQAQAKLLEDLYRTHVPRLNAVGVVVEPPRYVDLARSYKETLGLHYPLAMVDQRSLAEHAELKKVRTVPAWVILDRNGRVHSSFAGALSLDALSSSARSAE